MRDLRQGIIEGCEGNVRDDAREGSVEGIRKSGIVEY